MNQETKDKIEQVAQRKWEEDQATNPTPVNPHAYVYGFKSGAQTILDNPELWGLQDIEDSDERWCEVVDQFKQEADRYRRALEKITDGNLTENQAWKIAKEALKQEESDTESLKLNMRK